MKPSYLTATKSSFAILFLILSLPAILNADANVTLNWVTEDAEPEGYILYYRTADQEYSDERSFDVGPDITETIYGLEENVTFYFVVRAYIGDLMSDDSNEVVYNSNGQFGNSLANGSSSAGSSGTSAGCLIQSLLCP